MMNGSLMGIVSNIQRMSVHDGPGLRTTVFFKGCNMRCKWCHNPESIHTEPEYVFNEKLCKHCGMCEQGCYSGARTLCGKEMSVEEILTEVHMDMPYYGDDGGITISGGEPFMQHAFLFELLRAANNEGIQCALETNASFPFEIIQHAIDYVKLWMIDMKAFDDDVHKKYTGISNAAIKENLRKLDALGARIILRTPVVPGVNDADEELNKIIGFAKELKNLVYYEVLPYHPLGLSKQVANTDFIECFKTPNKEELLQQLLPTVEKHKIQFRFANRKVI